VTVDRKDHDEGQASAGQERADALFHELSEALNALGNYLAAAQQKFPDSPELAELLLKAGGQHDRACRTLRRLRAVAERARRPQ
jgi:TolA-binding protein